MVDLEYFTIAGLIFFIVEFIGIIFALNVVMSSRSSQGTIAWSMSLIMMPFFTIPLYLLFGRTRFNGYAEKMRDKEKEIGEQWLDWHKQMLALAAPATENLKPIYTVVNRLTSISFTQHNQVRLLIDAKLTYQTMLDAIALAKNYVFVQFFIVRDDTTSQRLREALIAKAREGLRVYFLYDEIGCFKTPDVYFEKMRNADINVSSFKTTKGRNNRFQINFRNHRKLLIIDGDISFVGGLNLGDEYLGFRDTHMRIEGPASQHIQFSFLKDWYWATGKIPEHNKTIKLAGNANQAVSIVNTGPADDLANCSILFASLIRMAQHRLWITSPYFVPDDVMLRTLQAAAIRGVDVRIILPGKADHKTVELASFTYYESMMNFGVRLFRYRERFMHQKVILIDNDLAGVGTVNIDNRSIYLNFEATGLVADKDFVQEVETMLLTDLHNSNEVHPKQYDEKPFWFRIAARISRLASPLL
ncbi:MAG: cardiolipin synthase [Thiohalomonadales bacterium]